VGNALVGELADIMDVLRLRFPGDALRPAHYRRVDGGVNIMA
jgi:hypothetical protein